MKVLLIEDEPKMVQTLKKGLEEHQIEVDFALDGITGLMLSDQSEYAVIISDIILPGGVTGLDVIRQIRYKGNQTPVILLTALGLTDDKIAGFDAGADDYLTKPFEFRELLVRIKALSRRKNGNFANQSILRYADIELNLDAKTCTRSGLNILLTPREFALLEYFLRNSNRVISKSEISEKVWNLDFDTGTNVVEVYVNFLRKKLEKGFNQKVIHTQFKNGYILRTEE
ncbi:MAG: response regulator transcription factor [Bacteroidetes bacterium]|nr:response regulator transcription factor [Bacteroidota bacterium]